jgi:hypothetical protein
MNVTNLLSTITVRGAYFTRSSSVISLGYHFVEYSICSITYQIFMQEKIFQSDDQIRVIEYL